MISTEKYITASLEANLFWLRIMKEHSIFIEAAIPTLQSRLIYQADQFRQRFSNLLIETIRLANENVSKEILHANLYFTQFTEVSEEIVQQTTGIDTGSNLTRLEYNISPMTSYSGANAEKEQAVSSLNQRILAQTDALIHFKAGLYADQASCRLFTSLYTAELNHVLQEAKRYFEILNSIQGRNDTIDEGYKDFWNQRMAEHAKSMRGRFDPTEVPSFNQANRFAQIYEDLLKSNANPLPDTQAISQFKANTTQGLIECKVRAIMSPLFTDHLLREANYYIYSLQRQNGSSNRN